jgi:FtsH-binding integral membrane protein
MVKFVLPGYYIVISRLKAPWATVSWLVMYPFAASFGALYFVGANICSHAIVYGVAFMACLSVYEIGYLENDYMAIREEGGLETQRLNRSDASVLDRYYRRIVVCKCLVSLLLCMLTLLVAVLLHLEVTINMFVAALILMYFAFLAHNHLRSRWSIATFMTLCCLKYLVPIFLFPVRTAGDIITLIVTAIVLIPLLRTIEYSTKRRFRLESCSTLVGNLDWFRVKYYVVVAGICAALYLMHHRQVKLLLMSSIFMVIFRIATLVLSIRFKLRNKEMIGVSIADQQGRSR